MTTVDTKKMQDEIKQFTNKLEQCQKQIIEINNILSTISTNSTSNTSNISSNTIAINELKNFNKKITTYIDDKIDELKINIIKYVDDKFKRKEVEGKELVTLSGNAREEVVKEVNSIIKRDVVPMVKQVASYIQYTTFDGDQAVFNNRMNMHNNNLKQITNGKQTSGHANPLHASLFVFDGED